jgi:hypothetical protein
MTQSLREFIFYLRRQCFFHGRTSPADGNERQARGGCSGGWEGNVNARVCREEVFSAVDSGAMAAGASTRVAGGSPGSAASHRAGGQVFMAHPDAGRQHAMAAPPWQQAIDDALRPRSGIPAEKRARRAISAIE